jgi:hypothetical protein
MKHLQINMKTILFFLLIHIANINVYGQSNLTISTKDDSIQTEINGEAGNRASKKTDDKTDSETSLNWLIISGIIGIIGSSFAWTYNERQKRIEKLVSEKEKRYRKLIKYIRSFGHGSEDEKKANEFILELQQCWMYCPDIVIEKGNIFIESMRANNQNKTDLAKGEFVLEMRKDLMFSGKIFKFCCNENRITRLKAIDFKDVYYKSKNNERKEKCKTEEKESCKSD